MKNKTTYHGSCECENVRIEATFDLSEGTFKCDCRMCTKSRFWGVLLTDPGLFKVVSGEKDLVRYGNGPVHHFCGQCGIKIFGRGQFTAVNVALFDDLDPRALAKAPVKYYDGRNDRFDREPEFKDHL